jgi:hypothetical protein
MFVRGYVLRLLVGLAVAGLLGACAAGATLSPPPATPAARVAPSVAAVAPTATATPTSASTAAPTCTPTATSAGKDDTAMLQAKLDACVPGGPTCTVRIPAGTYLTKQLLVNGFHGTVAGAGEATTVIQALPGYVVAPGSVLYKPPSPTNPYPYIMTFGGGSDVSSRT